MLGESLDFARETYAALRKYLESTREVRDMDARVYRVDDATEYKQHFTPPHERFSRNFAICLSEAGEPRLANMVRYQETGNGGGFNPYEIQSISFSDDAGLIATLRKTFDSYWRHRNQLSIEDYLADLERAFPEITGEVNRSFPPDLDPDAAVAV